MIRRIKIRSHDLGLHFKDGDFKRVLRPGTHWFFDPLFKSSVERVEVNRARFTHDMLDVIAKSGLLEEHATILDLSDSERGLVWVDGRFADLLGPGRYVYWNQHQQIDCEIVDATQVRFQHAKLKRINGHPAARQLLDVCTVKRDHEAALFVDESFVEILPPGLYAFWLTTQEARVVELDRRELTSDVSGQEIMTADKVSIRINALVSFRIADVKQAISAADDVRQTLYRQTQLALRAIVGTKRLDEFLSDKDAVCDELAAAVSKRQAEFGLEIISVGIRDVILPGEMKDLLNQVTEAQKAAEANLISRREETAAMRSQANTAKLLADNPTLMRLRELEVLQQIASSGNLNVVLGEKGLADRVTNLL